jgi:uroporphyrinogen-III decarboxylase
VGMGVGVYVCMRVHVSCVLVCRNVASGCPFWLTTSPSDADAFRPASVILIMCITSTTAAAATAATAAATTACCRGIEPDEARRRVEGTHKSLQGNMDPCALYGTPATIRAEVTEMLAKFGTQGYIANLGHGMLPSMNPDHAQVFITSVQEVSTAMNGNAAMSELVSCE